MCYTDLMDTKTSMTIARFWRQVNIVPGSNSTACWLWQGSKLPSGYGICCVGNSKTELAHRFVTSLTYNIDNKVVAHHCDNPGCVRPDHLFVTDQAGNLLDQRQKDRKRTVLTRPAVLDIRTKRITRAEFAELYGCSMFTVGQVQRRETWQHVN
jgi:hypothetical protein